MRQSIEQMEEISFIKSIMKRCDKRRMCHPIVRTVDSLYGLKLLVTKRSTKEDFPTPVSPSKTTLTSRGFSSGAFILTLSLRNKTGVEETS